jgi:hypothetical protein
MKSTLLSLLSLTFIFGGCGKDDTPPSTPPTHHLEARITGNDLTGMDATVEVWRDYPLLDRLYLEALPTSVGKTIDLGTYGNKAMVSGAIRFFAVTPGSSIEPRPTTNLKLELLADGRVIETTVLNQAKTGFKVSTSPVLAGQASIETAKL